MISCYKNRELSLQDTRVKAPGTNWLNYSNFIQKMKILKKGEKSRKLSSFPNIGIHTPIIEKSYPLHSHQAEDCQHKPWYVE